MKLFHIATPACFVHCKYGNIRETAQDGVVVTVEH